MKSFTLEFYAALTALFTGLSLLLYLFDIPFHYFPHLPFFFAVVGYEKRPARRLAAVLLNAILFSLLAHELPFLFVLLLFAQLYLFSLTALEVTTFDLSIVLIFMTFISSVIVSTDIALYRFAFTGDLRLFDLLLSVLANLAAIIAVFLFRKGFIDTLYTRDSWL